MRKTIEAIDKNLLERKVTRTGQKGTLIVCVWHWRPSAWAVNLLVGARSMQLPPQQAAGAKHQTSLLLSTCISAWSSGEYNNRQFGPEITT